MLKNSFLAAVTVALLASLAAPLAIAQQVGIDAADVRVAAEYETQYAQHCPMEPHICVTHFDPQGRLMIITSTQVPFHARRIVAQVCGLPEGKIRVIKPRIA